MYIFFTLVEVEEKKKKKTCMQFFPSKQQSAFLLHWDMGMRDQFIYCYGNYYYCIW